MLVAEIDRAFAPRARPAAQDIAHCAYDKRYGGLLDGPCAECKEMNEYLGGRDWRDIPATDLRRYGQGDAQMTVRGYCYLLPAYLRAALEDRAALDICVDHLAYRFGPEGEDEYGSVRLAQVLAELSAHERSAVLAYFRHTLDLEDDWRGFVGRSIANLEASLGRTAP